MKQLIDLIVDLIEREKIPDFLIRLGIRYFCWQRLREQTKPTIEEESSQLATFRDAMNRSPIAILTEKANEQHYEVPAQFFELVLGPYRKYSSCYFNTPFQSLEEAEKKMLQLTCERAEIFDGQTILELGCGWGSLTLWMASQFPRAHIVAVSNSKSQKEFIEHEAKQRALKNVEIVTADINQFSIARKFDRVVSVEMFEHMRNWGELLSRIARWLSDDGKLFIHIFCHKNYVYTYETEGSANWMGRYFFSGGMMPSESLLFWFQQHLEITNFWRVDGTHYARTSEKWDENMRNHQFEILSLLRNIYGEEDARRWFMRWRLFFLACAELFGFRSGREWYVAHYLLQKHSDHYSI